MGSLMDMSSSRCRLSVMMKLGIIYRNGALIDIILILMGTMLRDRVISFTLIPTVYSFMASTETFNSIMTLGTFKSETYRGQSKGELGDGGGGDLSMARIP